MCRNTTYAEIFEKVLEKELQKEMGEEEVEVKKERERKRGEEEEEETRSGSNIDDFLSKEAFELMKKKLLKKGFIGDRGFKEMILPFKEVIEKINWIAICENLPFGRATIVREFYANLVDRKETMCYVRGKWISLHRKNINHMCGLGKLSDGAKFRKLKENPDYQKILEVLTDGKREWKGSKKKPNVSIARGHLTEEAKVWFYFLKSVSMPSKHVCTMRQEETILL